MPARRPNVTYMGGPYSGQEDYHPRLPEQIQADDSGAGIYARTDRIMRGHVVYEWVVYRDAIKPC